MICPRTYCCSRVFPIEEGEDHLVMRHLLKAPLTEQFPERQLSGSQKEER